MDPYEDHGGGRRPWSAARIGLTLLVVGLVGFWVWVFLFAPRGNPARLEAEAFTERAEELCSATHVAVDALPSPRETPLPADRAVQVAVATDLTATMISELQAATSLIPDPEELEVVERWLDDWDTYLGDRERHYEKLQTADENTSGHDLRFTISETASGGAYTTRIAGFANVNHMASCRIPGDI